MRVLVVEPEKYHREILSLAFGKEGIETVCVSSVTDAIRSIAEQRPDAIITELVIPVRSGFDLTEALRSDLSTSDIPVIVLTTQPEKMYGGRCRELGVVSYITKPFSLRDVVTRVKKILGKRRVA